VRLFGKPPTSFSSGAANETRHRFCSQVTLAFVYTKIMFNEQQPRTSWNPASSGVGTTDNYNYKVLSFSWKLLF